MKKSKVFVLTILSVILCLMIMCTSSFSWFTRGTQTGGYFIWSNNNSETAVSYNNSNGEGISVKTYSSPDGNTYGENEVTNFSNEIAVGNRKYYRTDISNSGNADQAVSLYLSNLKITSGNFYLGVNDPLKTYKNYSFGELGTKNINNVNLRNIYVGFNVNQTYTYANYKVKYTTSSGSTGESPVSSTAFKQQGGYLNSKYNMCYATVPYDTEKIQLVNNSGTKFGGELTVFNENTKNTVVLYLWQGSYHTEVVQSGLPAGIENFYSSAFVAVGDTMNISATGETTSFSYSSKNTDVVTVDSNGNITGKKAGSAVVTVTANGAVGYEDKPLEANCVVTVGSQNNEVPVITNLNIPSKTDDKDSVVSVYWYIKNESDSEILQYTVDDLYISL